MARPKKEPVIKECPVCGTEHTKRGIYCGKVCSNKGRVVTDEQKAKTSESMKKFMYSDSDVAEEARWRINNHKDPDNYEPVVPHNPFDSHYEVSSGDIWFDVD